MPAMANIVFTHESVDSTFKPRGQDANGVTTFVESTGVPIADRRLTYQRSRTAAGREKVSIKATYPVVATATGEDGVARPQLLRTSYCDIVFSFDATSTLGERYEMRDHMRELLAEQPAIALADLLDYIY